MGTCAWEDHCGFQELRTGDTDLWIHLAHIFTCASGDNFEVFTTKWHSANFCYLPLPWVPAGNVP